MNNRRAFIVGIKSSKLQSKEKSFLRKYKPWGVILFTRNIKDINQTLIDSNSKEIPLKNANKADMRIKTKIITSNISIDTLNKINQ